MLNFASSRGEIHLKNISITPTVTVDYRAIHQVSGKHGKLIDY
jgi:hypothetical protein